MPPFEVRHATLGDQPLVELHDRVRGRTVRIAHRGATVLSIRATHRGRAVELADGYRDATELLARPGSRFAVLAPFANRIAQGRYTFDGVAHDLQPGVPEDERGVRHGFVRDAPFALHALEADAQRAEAVFVTQIAADAQPGYPFALALQVRYVLDAAGLTLDAGLTNRGTIAAPAFVGWHPYFRLGDAPLARWELAIPAATVVATDAQSIPLPDDAACRALDEHPPLDFRSPRAIGELTLDHAYADLCADADGRCRSTLRDPASGLGLTVWQERGVLLAFSGDSLARDPRRALALEPMESWADAFNRPACAAAIRLAAGATRRFRCGVTLETA